MDTPDLMALFAKKPIAFVGENGNDLCVFCKEDTFINAGIPTALRRNYLTGKGQLCFSCAKRINDKRRQPILAPVEIS